MVRGNCKFTIRNCVIEPGFHKTNQIKWIQFTCSTQVIKVWYNTPGIVEQHRLRNIEVTIELTMRAYMHSPRDGATCSLSVQFGVPIYRRALITFKKFHSEYAPRGGMLHIIIYLLETFYSFYIIYS